MDYAAVCWDYSRAGGIRRHCGRPFSTGKVVLCAARGSPTGNRGDLFEDQESDLYIRDHTVFGSYSGGATADVVASLGRAGDGAGDPGSQGSASTGKCFRGSLPRLSP